MTAVITIGLSGNDTLGPLPDALEFVNAVTALVARATVYVSGARSVGQWTDETSGETVTEESVTWVVDDMSSDLLRAGLATLARTYRQDAIALTIGNTDLVGASGE